MVDISTDSITDLDVRANRLAEATWARLLRQERKRQAEPYGGLMAFIRYFWEILEPAQPFVEGWALQMMCEHLEAVTRGDHVILGGVDRKLNRVLMNVPPGFMKEIHVDEPVLTKRGRIRLGEVVAGDYILTHKGRYREVQQVSDKGTQPTLLITTNAGRKVRAELSHPFLTTRGWIEAQHLEVGDILAAVTPTEEGMTQSIPAKEARLLGYIVGDGSVTHSPGFTNADEEVLIDFIDCATAAGMSASRRGMTPSAKARNAKATLVGVRGAKPWLEKYNLAGKSSYTKRIPAQVLAADRETIAQFVGAYWSCDGNLTVRHSGARGSIYVSSCTTVSEGLAHDIQHALLRLGINSRIRARSHKMESKAQPGGVYRFWMVMTCSHEDTVKFQELTALCSRKRETVTGLVRQRFDQGPLYEDEIVSIEEAGLGECRCLLVDEDHSFTANDLAVHNSLLTNVWWPAWEWGPRGMPHLRYVAFSYASELTERDNQKFRDLICSEPYKEMWGHVFKVVGDGKVRITNDKTGFKFASSVGGVGTGERGDRVLADDLHKIKASESDEARKSIVTWGREAMSNRLNSLAESVIIAIMQRTHEEDFSGAIMKHHSQEYCHLIIPMEYESHRHLTHLPGFEDPRRYDGELAWPERYRALELGTFRANPYLWAGQYQQNPAPRGGGIFKEDWWQMYEIPPSRQFEIHPIMCIASLDTAFKENEENDYSALTVWWLYDDPKTKYRKIMMVDAFNKRLPLHGPRQPRKEGEDEKTYLRRVTPKWGLVEWVHFMCLKRGVTRLLIEDSARGHDVGKELQRLYANTSWGVHMVPARGDKWSRANAVVDIFTDEMVFAPGEWLCARHNKPHCMDPLCPDETKSWCWRDWAAVVINQCSLFPRGAHDDAVDTVTQVLRHLRENSLLVRRDEKFEQDQDDALYRPTQVPLYPC